MTCLQISCKLWHIWRVSGDRWRRQTVKSLCFDRERNKLGTVRSNMFGRGVVSSIFHNIRAEILLSSVTINTWRMSSFNTLQIIVTWHYIADEYWFGSTAWSISQPTNILIVSWGQPPKANNLEVRDVNKNTWKL